MRSILIVLAVMVSSTTLLAAAEKSDAKKADATGGGVVASVPGTAVVARAAEISAQVVAIDKATRTISLKGPKGNVVDIVAGEEVKNFAQINVGDFVMVRFLQSLALELQKTKSGAGGITHVEIAAQAKPGERPAAGVLREVSAIAKVTAIDKKAKTISLKGPRGNTVTLDVQNPEHFNVVKVGDEVLVAYTEAVAISVESAPKAAAPKK